MRVKYTRTELRRLPKRKLIEIILQHQEALFQLEVRMQTLEGQPQKDSHNSHLPPSQSPPLPVKNLRQPTGRQTGGQPGHPGHTLKLVDQPTRSFTCTVDHCQACGRDLRHQPVNSYERRQVFDIPHLQLEVIEYRVEKKRCPCGHLTPAAFPVGVEAPVQYGVNLQTLVSLLDTHGFLSRERTCDMVEYLTGQRLSEATIDAIQQKLYTHLADFEQQTRQHLVHSEVIHVDETSVPVDGRLAWAHVTSTAAVTYYAIDLQRGRKALNRIGILPRFRKKVVHDYWRAYLGYQKCLHCLCNSHHLRELTFFEEEEKARWAGLLKKHLLVGKAAVEQARQAGQEGLTEEYWLAYAQKYAQILHKGLRHLPPPVKTGRRGKPTRTGQRNLAERLLTHQAQTLRFMTDFRVPFSNNQAERDLRMFKVKDKVSGTFRTFRGARCFARLRGYLSTVRKQGRNVFTEVRNALLGQPFRLPQWQPAD